MFAPSVYNAYSNTPVNRSMVPWWGYRRNWTDPFDQMERWMQSMDRYYDEHMGFQVSIWLYLVFVRRDNNVLRGISDA